MSKSAGEAESETRPEVLADLLILAGGTVIPARVIATWTPQEREEAVAWAAAEHLSASDNPVVRPPQPPFVLRAAEICASPALAQLAVEAWTAHREVLRYAAAAGEDGATERFAQDAVTGLLVLLGPSRRAARPSWQEAALKDLALHPEGLSAAEIMALGGQHGPSSREELHEWLRAREEDGTVEAIGFKNWRLKGTRL
jgi:hypothetical protein